MDIDIKRLEWDAAYWLKCDPSDGEATHYEPTYNGHEAAWVRIFNGVRHYFLNHGWVNVDASGDEMGCVEDMIPRPKPQSQEWDGEGLPPVGVKCEFKDKLSDDSEWKPCVILAAAHFHVIFQEIELLSSSPCESAATWTRVKFRPIRTKAEREREELAGIIKTECENHFPSPTRWNEVADAIISAGWKKERT